MQKSVEFTGKDQDAAIAAALEQLGLSREEISVEVLEFAKPGFLGIGGTPAKIKVTFEAPDEPVVEPPAPVVKEPPVEKKVPVEHKAPAAPAAEEDEEVNIPFTQTFEVEPGDPKAAKIVDFLTGLLERMEVEATANITVDAEGNYLVELEGKNLGQIIGHRGETLDAIQQLTGYAVNKGESKRVRVRIDAEGYRSKREESLARMANRVADKVLRFRRNMTLEPMNAYERHVVHTALQGRPDVTTYSVGAEPNRRIVVAYAPGENR